MVEYFKVEKIRTPDIVSSYGQIMARTPNVKIERNRSTTAHEATHYINSSLRSKAIRNKDLKGKYNGFYVVNRGGIYLLEPPFPKSVVANYIPESIRGRIFPTYIAGALDWEDRPLYIVDEWVSFYNGGIVAVEDFNTGKHNGDKFGAVSGLFELSVYTIGLCMCIIDRAIDHWYNFPEMRLFVIDQLGRSKTVFELGRNIEDFADDKLDRLIYNLRSSPDCLEFRTFMDDELENAWRL
jgi:hypothetical protein